MTQVSPYPTPGTGQEKPSQPTLEELINRCKFQDKAAFNEIMKRHMGLIKNEIRRIFGKCYLGHLGYQEDVVQDVLEMITKKIVRCLINPSEDGFRNPWGFPNWLKKTAQTQTFEWLRQQNRRDDVINNMIESLTDSLDQPVGEEGTSTLIEVLTDESLNVEGNSAELNKTLESVLLEISELPPKKRLMMKTILMHYDSLEPLDIAQIAENRGTSREQIRAEVDDLACRLVEKNERRILEQGKAQNLWYRVRALEFRKSQLLKDGLTDQSVIAQIEDEMAEKGKKLSELRKVGQDLIRPTSKEIGKLLDLTEEEVKKMATDLFRIRKRLKELVDKGEEGSFE